MSEHLLMPIATLQSQLVAIRVGFLQINAGLYGTYIAHRLRRAFARSFI